MYLEKKLADEKLLQEIQKAKDEVTELQNQLLQESEKTILSL
jgi:hypothetical protein